MDPIYPRITTLGIYSRADKLIGDEIRDRLQQEAYGSASSDSDSEESGISEGEVVAYYGMSEEEPADQPTFPSETPRDFDRARQEALDPGSLNEEFFPPVFHPFIGNLRAGRNLRESLVLLETLRDLAEQHRVPQERIYQLRAQLLLRLASDLTQTNNETLLEISPLFASAIQARTGRWMPNSAAAEHLRRELCFQQSKILYQLGEYDQAYATLRSAHSYSVNPVRLYRNWKLFNEELLTQLINTTNDLHAKARWLKKRLKLDRYTDDSDRLRDCLALAQIRLEINENSRHARAAIETAIVAAGTILSHVESRYDDLGETPEEFRSLKAQLLLLNTSYEQLVQSEPLLDDENKHPPEVIAQDHSQNREAAVPLEETIGSFLVRLPNLTASEQIAEVDLLLALKPVESLKLQLLRAKLEAAMQLNKPAQIFVSAYQLKETGRLQPAFQAALQNPAELVDALCTLPINIELRSWLLQALEKLTDSAQRAKLLYLKALVNCPLDYLEISRSVRLREALQLLPANPEYEIWRQQMERLYRETLRCEVSDQIDFGNDEPVEVSWLDNTRRLLEQIDPLGDQFHDDGIHLRVLAIQILKKEPRRDEAEVLRRETLDHLEGNYSDLAVKTRRKLRLG